MLEGLIQQYVALNATTWVRRDVDERKFRRG